MVEHGSWACLEINDSDLFTEPLPTDVAARAVWTGKSLLLAFA